MKDHLITVAILAAIAGWLAGGFYHVGFLVAPFAVLFPVAMYCLVLGIVRMGRGSVDGYGRPRSGAKK